MSGTKNSPAFPRFCSVGQKYDFGPESNLKRSSSEIEQHYLKPETCYRSAADCPKYWIGNVAHNLIFKERQREHIWRMMCSGFQTKHRTSKKLG